LFANVVADSLAAHDALLPSAASTVLFAVFVDSDATEQHGAQAQQQQQQQQQQGAPVSRAWDDIVRSAVLRVLEHVVVRLREKHGLALSDLSTGAKEDLLVGVRFVLLRGPPQLALENAQRSLAVAQATKQLAGTGLDSKDETPDANDDKSACSPEAIERTFLPAAQSDNRARCEALAHVDGLVAMIFATIDDSARETSVSASGVKPAATVDAVTSEVEPPATSPPSAKYSASAVAAACESIAAMCQSSTDFVQALVVDARHDIILQCVELRSNSIDVLIEQLKSADSSLVSLSLFCHDGGQEQLRDNIAVAW
jgi:hypothetical protein